MIDLLGGLQFAVGNLPQHTALAGAGSLFYQIAVEHHQHLWNRAVEARRFVAFVSSECGHKLLQPLILDAFLLFVRPARLLSLGGNQQGFVELFGTHLPQVEMTELGRFAKQRIIGFVGRRHLARELIRLAEHNPFD